MWLAKTVTNESTQDCRMIGNDLIFFESIGSNKCNFNTDLGVYQNFIWLSFNILGGKLLLLICVQFFPRRLLICRYK